jgi:hypothetical protein
VRCGGDWRRDYGDFYTGTKGETPDTAKKLPTNYRASSRPYQVERRLVLILGRGSRRRRHVAVAFCYEREDHHEGGQPIVATKRAV